MSGLFAAVLVVGVLAWAYSQHQHKWPCLPRSKSERPCLTKAGCCPGLQDIRVIVEKFNEKRATEQKKQHDGPKKQRAVSPERDNPMSAHNNAPVALDTAPPARNTGRTPPRKRP